MQRLQGGLVFQARRLLYYSTLGLRVIKKRRSIRAVLVVLMVSRGAWPKVQAPALTPLPGTQRSSQPSLYSLHSATCSKWLSGGNKVMELPAQAPPYISTQPLATQAALLSPSAPAPSERDFFSSSSLLLSSLELSDTQSL